ncbi:hypothetical protein NTG1052_560016 [Candidatus Nitrotoga sp. 1052]|nr:hypothetical protein NTG1052_560016 [Candidatus Nitrotoga sp. 1052]
MAGASSRGKARDVVVKVRLVLGQRHARAVAQAAPMLLLVSLLLAHRHRTVPVDTVVKQCIRQDAEPGN